MCRNVHIITYVYGAGISARKHSEVVNSGIIAKCNILGIIKRGFAAYLYICTKVLKTQVSHFTWRIERCIHLLDIPFRLLEHEYVANKCS